MNKLCTEDIKERKPSENKYFDKNDKRFEKNPFEVCVVGFSDKKSPKVF